jgi:acetyl-CoA carboxylase biotin carboxyl carrier protein
MDLEELDSLLKLLKEHDVGEYRFKDDNCSIQLRRGAFVAAAAPAAVVAAAPAAASVAASAVEPAAEEVGVTVVESPMVGTFYRAPSPEAPAFVEVGATVTAGQTLCIVEAMKLMNEIEAEVSGTITAILVEDAQPVQFGEPLVKIKAG